MQALLFCSSYILFPASESIAGEGNRRAILCVTDTFSPQAAAVLPWADLSKPA